MRKLGPEDAIVVVDVQRDFCAGGALAVPGGDEVVPTLNAWLDRAAEGGAAIYASRDWHPPDHVSFHARGGPWPPHCVQGTEGAALHPDLRLPEGATILSKGHERDRDAYSAFDGTGLEDRLRERGVRRLYVGGLAQDVCVRATVRDALSKGFDAHLIVEASRPVEPEATEEILRELEEAGAVLEREGRA